MAVDVINLYVSESTIIIVGHFIGNYFRKDSRFPHQQVTNNHQTFTISTNHLAAGVYMVKLTGNNTSHRVKIIKLE
ncbi:MAG: T9SS type A sorting domain-containing protein [Breznakibacter sp.]|nr:T9SS type A sorting domain-containing protein [Breznakibacter sp.]